MLSVLAVKEIRENLLSLKFYLILIVSVSVIVVSVGIMARDYNARLANYSILKPGENEARAIIPPSPLSIFVRGLDEQIGTAYEISFGGQIEVGSSQQAVNKVFKLFSTPDLLYIIRVVLSLAAILFAFDRLSGEKESRTLALLLSAGCSRTSCISGKWLGGLVSFFIPLIPALIIALTVVLLTGRITLSGSDLGRLVLIAGISGLYLTFFFTLGLLVSSRTSSPSTSLVISLFLWVLLVFIVPGMGQPVARAVQPLPTFGQIEMRRQHVWIREIFAMIKRQKANDSPQDDVGGAVFKNINQGNQEITDNFRPKLVARAGLAADLSRLSPAGSLILASTELAGTGPSEMIRLVDEVIRYKNRVFAVSPVYMINQPTNDPIPSFSYRRASIREVFPRGVALDLLLLTAWLLVALSLAYLGFIRADIR